MRTLILLLVFGFFVECSTAQTAQDNREILEPVNAFFKGMSLGDSAMIHATLYKGATLATVMKDKDGVPFLRQDDIQKFLNAIGTPHDEKWSEPIWDVKIHMDGNLAQLWAKYAFYIGKTFSHCGADAFQLIKGQDGKWKIFSIVDTRQKEGCVVSPAIANQYK